MKVRCSTTVAGNVSQVFSRFDRSLFEALKPPGLPFRLDRYDGNAAGDRVHVTIGAPLLPQRWESVIVERGQSASECFFVDEGRILPFPLKFWRHVHRVRTAGEQVEIIDDIDFRTALRILDPLMWLVISFMMKLRRPVYRSFFGSMAGE